MAKLSILAARVSGVALLMSLLPAAALAQTSLNSKADVTGTEGAAQANNQPPQVNADGTTPAEEGGELVVTGSRIHDARLNALQPTVSVSSEYLQERGITNVADALNENPIYRGSITPNGAQGSFGQGVNFVNQFNLGSARTLTLINGRRFVTSAVPTQFGQTSSPAGQVDLNVVNTLLLQDVENHSIGGAPVYGSDAIAGTTNVILRDRYNGFTVSGTDGVTEQGDGFHYSLSALAGHDYLGGRANLTVAYQHDHQDGVLANARDFYRQNIGAVTNPCSVISLTCSATSASYIGNLGRLASGITYLTDGRVNTNLGYNNSTTDNIPGTIYVKNQRIYTITPGGVIASVTGNSSIPTYSYQFDPNGNIVPFNRGITFPSIYASGGDGFALNDYSQIQSLLNRDILNAFGHFDVSDALKFFFEGEYFHSRGDELVQQPTYNATAFSGTSAALTIPATYAFLNPQARATLARLGVTQFVLSRGSTDLADLTGYSTTDLGRMVLGARGDFKVGGREFNYEVAANYGRNVVHDHGQDVNAQHFINAVNVTTNAQGQIVCNANVTAAQSVTRGYAPVADPACVPLDLLGSGQSTAAARAYVVQQSTTVSILQQKDLTAFVSGSPFSLFGNDYKFSAGYEHREEDGDFEPSSFQRLGLGRSVAITSLSGSYNVDEVYAEAELPIVAPQNHVPLINELTIQASGRHVDNTVNGGFFSWSAGGGYRPIHDILFRGNYTKSFRAPSVTELFLPVSSAFSAVPDLCSSGNINSGNPKAIRQANCAAFLAKYPTATPLLAAAVTVPILSGGNQNLQNEVSRSFTYGVELQPRFIRGLTVAADYISIDISNPITSLTVAQIASACFDNPNFDTSDPANGNQFCSLIKRDSTGQVLNNPATPGVTAGYVNGNRIYFSGIQGTVSYSVGLDGLGIPGQAGLDNTTLFVRRRLIDTTGVAPTRTDGTFGDPKFQTQLNLRYSNDVWGVSTSINFVGRQIAARTGLSLDLREFNTIDSYVTVNPALFVNVNDKFRFTFSVTNAFNRVGQYYYGVIPTSVSLLNDALGRRFTAGVRATF